jgi:hypothetical protein
MLFETFLFGVAIFRIKLYLLYLAVLQTQAQFERERLERKTVHDELMTLRGNIRVFLRVRPKQENTLATVRVFSTSGSALHVPTDRRFDYDACLDHTVSHEEMFQTHVAPFVVSVSLFSSKCTHINFAVITISAS